MYIMFCLNILGLGLGLVRVRVRVRVSVGENACNFLQAIPCHAASCAKLYIVVRVS